MKILLHTLTLLLLSLATIAQEPQTQTIRGNIVDNITQYPLVGAMVGIQNNFSLTAISDEHGNFVITSVPLGRQTIEISYIGYKPQVLSNLLVVSGKETNVNVSLEEDAILITEVVVTANGPQEIALNEMASVSARAVSVEQTERFAGSLGDPARMASNYAGVTSKDDSRNDIVIRGNSPSGLLWRLEGIEIPNPNHFGSFGSTGGPVSMINNNLLTTSDFMTGAFPAEYGNALAGAFDLNLRSGNAYNHEFVGQVGFNGFEFGAEGPITKNKKQNASYLLNFRYSTLQVMDELGFDLGTGSAVPKYKDLTYVINMPTEKLGKFRVFGLWGDSYIQMGRDFADSALSSLYNSQGTATDFGSGLLVTGASNTYYFNKNLKLVTTLSQQQTYAETVFDSIINNSNTMPYVRQHMKEGKISVAQKLKYKYSSKLNFGAGYSYDFYNLRYVDSIYLYQYGSFKKGLDAEGSLRLKQGYVQTQYKPTNNITLYGGFHGQNFSLNKQTVIEPRASIQYDISKKQLISFGYGIHSQTQPRITYFHQKYDSITDTYTSTNKELEFTKNKHYVLAYNFKFAKHARIKAELYYQEISNVPISASRPEYSMLNAGADFSIANVQNLENSGTGTNKGIELTIERFLHNGFYTLITASLFDSKFTAYDGIERNTAFNGNYMLNVLSGYEYKISDKYMLTFDAKVNYAGGKRYVPIDIAKSKEEGNAVYNWSEAYNDKYEAYFRTDLRIGFKQNGKKFNQEWGLDLQNVTNYNSIFMEGYDKQTGELDYTYQQGFMPMMLYRIQF